MGEENDELSKACLALRDKYYRQAIEDAHDERDEKAELHLEREYNACDTTAFIDAMQDLILDSFGD